MRDGDDKIEDLRFRMIQNIKKQANSFEQVK